VSIDDIFPSRNQVERVSDWELSPIVYSESDAPTLQPGLVNGEATERARKEENTRTLIRLPIQKPMRRPGPCKDRCAHPSGFKATRQRQNLNSEIINDSYIKISLVKWCQLVTYVRMDSRGLQ
jgi:hypothetical protein